MSMLIGVEKMRVIISGGGTGGHIYPAIAIANKIKDKHPKAEILFIGTSSGLEADVIPKAGYPIKYISVSYLRRKISIHNVKSALLLIGGVLRAYRIIKDFKPDIVIGTGGFVCGPVVYAASKLGIKTLIHEQNAFPGLTNRILSRYVDTIALSFDEARKYFKYKDKLVFTGNPIREEFLKVTDREAYSKYKSTTDRPLVLIVGGSGGSITINQAVIDMLHAHPQNPFEILLVSGKKHYDYVLDSLSKNPQILKNNKVFPYIDDMPYAVKASDLIVCSSGAILIAELTAAEKASILIPKAYTAENHQEYNARALQEKGAAIVILENELNGEYLYSKIKDILTDKKILESMKKSSKRAAKINAADEIYNQILKLI